jgi:hypothetical protein
LPRDGQERSADRQSNRVLKDTVRFEAVMALTLTVLALVDTVMVHRGVFTDVDSSVRGLLHKGGHPHRCRRPAYCAHRSFHWLELGVRTTNLKPEPHSGQKGVRPGSDQGQTPFAYGSVIKEDKRLAWCSDNPAGL